MWTNGREGHGQASAWPCDGGKESLPRLQSGPAVRGQGGDMAQPQSGSTAGEVGAWPGPDPEVGVEGIDQSSRGKGCT